MTEVATPTRVTVRPVTSGKDRSRFLDFPYRHRKVKAMVRFERRDDGTVHYQGVQFRRYLSYPQTRLELRDVSSVPYSETIYQLENLRMPQETGGWPAVVDPTGKS